MATIYRAYKAAVNRTIDKSSTPSRPIISLPFEIRTPDIRSAFQSAVTGSLESGLKNNASLKAEDLIKLARGTYKNPTMIETSFVARPTFFGAHYTLASDINPDDHVNVNITNCMDAAMAQKMMADHLSMFQAPLSTVIRPLEKELGQVALRTESSIFWVRDALWVQIFIERRGSQQIRYVPGPELVQTVQTFSKSLYGLSIERIVQKTASNSMLKLATILDAYLANNAVLPARQLKPNTEVDKVDCKAKWGDSFVIKLVDVSDTHELSQVDVKDPSVALRTQNEDPNAKGVYTFFANQPGQTELSILVPRADNFAMDTVKVQVEITEG